MQVTYSGAVMVLYHCTNYMTSPVRTVMVPLHQLHDITCQNSDGTIAPTT